MVFCHCEVEPQDEGPVYRVLRSQGIPIHALDASGPFDGRTVLRLGRLLRSEHVAIVHTRLIRADFYGRLAGRLSGVPVVINNFCGIYTEHFRAWHGERMGQILYAIDRMTLPMAHVIVANAEGVREDLVKNVGLSAGRVVRIYNGIDLTRYTPPVGARAEMRGALVLPTEAQIVGVVARLWYQKGINYLLEAMQLLVANGSTAVLLIVGDGPERANLEAQAASLNLGHRVIFFGERADVPELLAAVDVFVFPSLFEGLPNAVLEAMAACLPVVASDIPGNNEVVMDGVTGYLVPAKNPAALAERIACLLGDPQLRQAMGQAGHSSVAEHFSIQAAVRQYEALYLEQLALRTGNQRKMR